MWYGYCVSCTMPCTPASWYSCIFLQPYCPCCCLSVCLLALSAAAVMLFHHILSIYGTSFVLYRGLNGAELMATICGSEMTNPFLQVRWFLHESNHHRTWYGEVNTVIFILLFTVTRVCVGTWFIIIYIQHPRPDLAAKLGSMSFYIISIVFWVHIVRYALKHFKSVYQDWQTMQLKTDDEMTAPVIQSSLTTCASGSGNIIRHSTILRDWQHVLVQVTCHLCVLVQCFNYGYILIYLSCCWVLFHLYLHNGTPKQHAVTRTQLFNYFVSCHKVLNSI